MTYIIGEAGDIISVDNGKTDSRPVSDRRSGTLAFICLFLAIGRMVTLVPIGTIPDNSSTSRLCMRMQPWETCLPMNEGLLVP